MKKLVHFDCRGLTLIELAVTLSLIGLMAGVAAVTLSSGDTALRSALRNFRFDIELAKHEAIARNAETFIDFFLIDPFFDANKDGAVNDKDRCYVIFQDRNGNVSFDPGADPPEEVKIGLLKGTVGFTQYQQLPFSPLGEGSQATFRLEAAVESNCDPVTSEKECLVTSYVLNVSEVGRVSIGEKQQICEEIDSCQ